MRVDMLGSAHVGRRAGRRDLRGAAMMRPRRRPCTHGEHLSVFKSHAASRPAPNP
jgi:hypothetical protein